MDNKKFRKRKRQDDHPKSSPPVKALKEPKMKREMKEAIELRAAIEKSTPDRGSKPCDLKLFEELPLSSYTKSALKMGNFVTMTEIQQASIPHALAGRDILGAAKTGSGKTLAFIIPLLEKLYRERWGSDDGLGAMVISPIRELALQIFEVLRTVGKYHDFAAGLVVGGKDFKSESERIGGMNIVICTPGRILQHLESSAGFDASHVQVLVLDEADRILDMGFEKDLKSIMEYINKEGRQTLLFSATQTKNVRDLARLNLKDPEYIGVHDKSEFATPKDLSQRYAVVELQDKMDVLWSFIKSHLKNKMLIFVSTAKQVRYLYEVLCKLRPGIPVTAIHGRMKQNQRMIAYYDFLEKSACLMLCTDIAARGLDWPGVEWVLQYDCPEDVPTYIHRVGRTARYDREGNALLLLLPSERPFVPLLGSSKIPIEETAINPTRQQSVKRNVLSIVAEDPEIKHLGQRAFISYVRSVHLMGNKEVFDASALPLDQYADSLGLAIVPKVKVSDLSTVKEKKNVNHKLSSLKDKIKAAKEEKKKKREAGEKKVAMVEEDDLLQVKRRDADEEEEEEEEEMVVPKRRKGEKGKRTVFDEDGNTARPLELLGSASSSSKPSSSAMASSIEKYQNEVAARLKGTSEDDKVIEKERLRAKRMKKKLKEMPSKKTNGDEIVATLGTASDQDSDSDDSSSSDGGSDEESSSGEGSSDGEDDIQDYEAEALRLIAANRK